MGCRIKQKIHARGFGSNVRCKDYVSSKRYHKGKKYNRSSRRFYLFVVMADAVATLNVYLSKVANFHYFCERNPHKNVLCYSRHLACHRPGGSGGRCTLVGLENINFLSSRWSIVISHGYIVRTNFITWEIAIMKKEVPVWEKSNLTLQEASAYFGVGINKLRELTDNENCHFVLWVGSKRLIKRKMFDEYLSKMYSI